MVSDPKKPMDTRAIGREIAREAMKGEATFDSLSEFGRTIVGSMSARMNLPLTDSVRAVGAMKLIVQEMTKLIMQAERVTDERSKLLMIGTSVRHLNQRINCFRRPRRGL